MWPRASVGNFALLELAAPLHGSKYLKANPGSLADPVYKPHYEKMLHLFGLECNPLLGGIGFAQAPGARTACAAAVEAAICARRQLCVMTLQYLVDFIHGELVQPCNLRVRTKLWRHDAAGLVLIIDVSDDPGFVLAVLAAPIRMRQKVGPGLKKDLDDAGTSLDFGRVWNLDQILWHC